MDEILLNFNDDNLARTQAWRAPKNHQAFLAYLKRGLGFILKI